MSYVLSKNMVLHNVQKPGVYMSTKGSRSGGKYTGSHTTIIPAAAHILDGIDAMTLVTKISLGIIQNSGPRGGTVRIHCRPLDDEIHGLKVTIAKGGSLQVVRVYLLGSARLDYVTSKIVALAESKGGKKKKKA